MNTAMRVCMGYVGENDNRPDAALLEALARRPASKVPASVAHIELRTRDRVSFGRTYPGQICRGQSALVVPGKRIVLFGAVAAGTKYVRDPATGKYGTNPEPIPYYRTFKVGDTCTVGSYNLTYFGTIVAIGPATVTVRSELGRTKRFTIERFSTLNHDLDIEARARDNANWND